VKIELLRGVNVRRDMLEILVRNNCSMDRKELIDRTVDVVYNRYCITLPEDERKKCREEAYEKAKTCLRDAIADGVVQVRGNKVVLPRCIHIREVSEGLKALLLTLEYVSPVHYHILQADIEAETKFQHCIRGCRDYLEYLRGRGINAEIVEDVANILKVLLEHLLTSKPFIKELLRHVIRKEEPYLVLDLSGEEAVKFRSVLGELRSEEAVQRIMVEGCCRRCVSLGLCNKCDVGEDDVKTIEVFIKMLLAVACKCIAPKFELI
jgi:hypothetical protein